MTMIYSGNFSASIPDNINNFNLLRIPIFYNNSKKTVILKGEETYDRITEKNVRTVIISSLNNKIIELKERPFNLIIECARKIASFLDCNLNINYKEIKNICFISVNDNNRLTLLTPIEIDENIKKINIDITDSNFIQNDTKKINNYIYPISIPVSINTEINIYSEYTDDRILMLNCINPLLLFPDEDCSKIKININKNSYNNIIFNIYDLQNFSIDGMSDYKEWNNFIFPEITFKDSYMDFNFVVDVTTSKIDIKSFEKLIKNCIEKRINFSFNTINTMSDLMSDTYICHPIFDDFFSYINNNKNVYDEIIEKIIQRQVNSLYTANNIIHQFNNILSLMDIMPLNSLFFEMVINNENKIKAHEYAERIMKTLIKYK